MLKNELFSILGVGTTLITAKKLRRKYIGFEISKEYCNIAEKRLKAIPERLDKWGFK